jgi:diguanylate cyclase (GGDEF)-like protein
MRHLHDHSLHSGDNDSNEAFDDEARASSQPGAGGRVVEPVGFAKEALWSAVVEAGPRIRITRFVSSDGDEHVGQYLDDLVHGDTLALATEALVAACETGTPQRFELTVPVGSSLRSIEVHVLPEREAHHVSGVAYDVTAERARLARLGQRDTLNRAVLDAIPSATAVVDARGVVQLINATWLSRAANLNRETPLPGDNVLEALEPAPEIAQGLRAVLSGERDDLDVDVFDGEQWWNVRAVPFELAGEPAAVLVRTDITERIQQRLMIEELGEARRRGARRMYEQRRLLELVASGTPLEDVLGELVLVGERDLAGSRWTVVASTPGGWADQITTVGVDDQERASFERSYRTFAPTRWDDLPAAVVVPGSASTSVASAIGFAGAIAAPILTKREVVTGFVLVRPATTEQDPDAEELVAQLASIARIAVERDATARREAERLLEDPLTGLPSHTLFHRRLEQAISRIGSTSRGLAVIYLDLDRFRRINESLGHSAGDAVLAEVASRLRAARPAPDTVARSGGDEFVVLLEDVPNADDGMLAATDLLAAIREPLELDGLELTCAASAGIVFVADPTSDAGTVESDAAIAMAAAKSHGRDRAERYSAALRTERPALATERELQRAVVDGQIVVHFQAEVSLDSNTVVGVEALARWQHPTRGMLLPLDFMEVAEESGAIVEIGREVLRQGCMQLAEWTSIADDPLTLSINLSPRQLDDPGLPTFVANTLDRFDIAPDRVRFEVTEQTLVARGDDAIERFDALRRLGVHVTIDDFGTGYSSFLHLRQYPADTVKIDRFFVEGLGHERGDATIIAAVISLAHELDLTVIAKGVERAEQVSYLRQLHCEGAQGYLWGQPMPPDSMSALLEHPLPPLPEDSTAMAVGGERRELDDLLSVLTHELSTPLTVIGGYAEMLADRFDADASARSGVAAIERNVQSLGQLVAALAEARGTVGATARVRLDCASLVADLRRETETAFGERPVTWHLPDRPVLVEADPAGLRQIVVNLLDNAVKFSPSGSPIEITVEAEPSAGGARVCVVDHGSGVPETRTGELFGRFARLGSTRRGLGLGLYLSRAIARRHGGDVTYEPTSGGGATFVLTVPPTTDSDGR